MKIRGGEETIPMNLVLKMNVKLLSPEMTLKRGAPCKLKFWLNSVIVVPGEIFRVKLSLERVESEAQNQAGIGAQPHFRVWSERKRIWRFVFVGKVVLYLLFGI